MPYKNQHQSPEPSPGERCVICGDVIKDQYGHDAHPIAAGKCCDVCNYTVVVPARMAPPEKKEETEKHMAKCSECNNCEFVPDKGGVNRYYCKHATAAASVNAARRLICRTERHSKELPVKTAPRWCPIKYQK